jgi:disease resistance protein RPM1
MGEYLAPNKNVLKNLWKYLKEITKKCGGVPLAIITTSSLLANKLGNMKEWYEFCESIGSVTSSSEDLLIVLKCIFRRPRD